MNFFQSIILGVVQGITEFLPISSDGHLNLFQHFFKLTPSLSFDVFLHAATFFSVLFFFRKQVSYFFSNLKFIIVGSIPVIIVGLFLKDQISAIFSDPKLLPFFFLVTAILVFATKFFKKDDKKITYLSAFVIGMLQSLAILPEFPVPVVQFLPVFYWVFPLLMLLIFLLVYLFRPLWEPLFWS